MFQRAKSFIIRRKRDPDADLELPDSSHLVRRPVTASMQDRINVRLIEKNPTIKPNMDFDTLRQKSTSLEQVRTAVTGPVLQKMPMVLSSDGLDTLRKKKESQKHLGKTTNFNNARNTSKIPVLKNNVHGTEDSKRNPNKSSTQKSRLFRVNSGKKKKNQDSYDQRNSFIFVKMEK